MLIVIKLSSGSPSDAGAGSPSGTALPAKVAAQITGVPASTLTKMGAAGATVAGTIKAVTDTPLTSSGKPEMLYIGAEFCPFCATERWAMAVALSRFGTLLPAARHPLLATDTPPSIPTVTFYKSTYTSKYLTFTPVENETWTSPTLQTPTSAQQRCGPSTPSSGFPFVDFGNKYVISGASYNYQVLQGKTWAQIAADLQDPSTDIARGADGAANQITAAICKLTSNQPATVCGTPLHHVDLQAKL